MKRLLAMLVVLVLVPLSAAASEPFTVAAKGAVLIDADSGLVLFGQNENRMLPMASTTKVMTALIALERSTLDEKVTAGKNASGVPGTSLYLSEGETLTMEQMLYGLMLRSGNDAAVAIAEHVAGSVSAFAALMNARAEQLNATAHYLNPHGLDEEGHGITALGLARVMRAAMRKAKSLRRLIAAHCEDNSLMRGGCIHDGEYAKAHGIPGICSESEWGQIARDIDLVRETGCGYHVCHISTRESVEIIRRAKAEGVNVTCETAPHYLLLTDMDLQDEGRFKMNPPVRSKEDRAALLEGLMDGTIDMIATDHAPHAAEEKAKGLRGSAMGIVGLETAFPLLYTYLVKKDVISLEKLVALMSDAPARRFGLESGIAVGADANLALWDLNAEYEIDSNDFLSMGRATPFAGWKVNGACVETLYRGSTVWQME